MPSECIAPWSQAGLLTCSNTATPPPECTCFDLPAAAAQVLAGGSAGIAALQSLTGLAVPPPLVLLNTDANDGASASPAGVSRVLTDEQEALLGCGPFFGTDCDATGIDLLAASASVLMQSFQGVRVPGVVPVPGSRGPGDPAYNPAVDGCVGSGPGCIAASAIANPLGSAAFQSEMAALSFNMQNLLVAFSINAGDPEIERYELDPLSPFSVTPGQCSFQQPQFCSNVIALLPEPEASLGAWVAMGVTVSLAARRKRAAR